MSQKTPFLNGMKPLSDPLMILVTADPSQERPSAKRCRAPSTQTEATEKEMKALGVEETAQETMKSEEVTGAASTGKGR